MALSVPNDPKVYTTKYANWRGVDFTNDASNVWYRRSPYGLNMLPNLDGQPFKRNGWKVEFTAQDFIEASGIVGVTSVEQYKVDYFEIGGMEYVWFYTSIGCFYYGDTLTFVDKSYEVGDDKPYDFSKSKTYAVGDYCMEGSTMYKCKEAIESPSGTLPSSDTTHWTDTEVVDGDEVAVDGSKTFPPTGKDIDYSKAFFFEGGGRAGYYLFASNTMYMFDGKKLHECKPTIPTVLTMADANGAGTFLYDVNILTDWRAIEYECDGSTTEYKIPDGFVNDTVAGQGVDGILNAYTINADGSYTPNYGWSVVNQGAITFSTAPAKTRPNQTSLRIVYKSASASISQNSYTSGAKNLKVTQTIVETTKQTRTVSNVSTPVVKNGKIVGHKITKKYSAWKNGTKTSKKTYANTTTASYALENPKQPISIERNIKNGSWSGNDSSVAVSVDAYGSKATLSGANNGKTVFDKCNSITASTSTSTKYTNVKDLSRTMVVTKKSVKTIPVRIKYNQWIYTVSQMQASEQRNAFFSTSKVLVFGNGIINQAFLTASAVENYSTRVWYSMATDPLYFPDTNYIEVGATDKKIMGLIKVGDYLGIVKQGSATDTSIYLAYATSFDDITTYAVKQSVNGIGAVSNGAFNILNDEPLFLSEEGVMGIEPAENDARKMRNRSYYINKKLAEESSLESAVSFVFGGMYWLAVDNHCYVLDGAQKTSWENTKTNLQYECYYLENIPATCFAKKDGRLWFIDSLGNACRFRDDSDELRYVDAYNAEALNDTESNIYKASSAPTLVDGRLVFDVDDTYIVETDTKVTTPYVYSDLAGFYANGLITNVTEFTGEQILDVINVSTYLYDIEDVLIRDAAFTTSVVSDETICSVPSGDSAFSPQAPYTSYFQIAYAYMFVAQKPENVEKDDVLQYGNSFYTVEEVLRDSEDEIVGYAVVDGIPIKAIWGTIADDDGSANYYKKLQKKGSMVALMPMSDSGVKVYLVPDEEDPIFVGETEVGAHTLPFNYYLKKKVKKYKRLQIRIENDGYNDGFGVDEIIKCYTVGNYAKK